MDLSEQQYHHLLKLASPQKFECFRDCKWAEEVEQKWITYDANVWKMEISSDDGLALLVLEHEYEPCETPKVIVDLVEYVMQIGSFGNYTFSLF